MISGAAFHWYSGDHFEQLDLVCRQYPSMKLIMSESCLEYRLSHYILPGSRRISTTTYIEQIDAAAYRLPDGKVLAILLNKGEKAAPITLRMENKGAQLLLPAGTMASCVIEDK